MVGSPHAGTTSACHQHLQTHIFDSENPNLESATVFAVEPSLIRKFEPRCANDPERPASVSGPWFRVQNDIVLVRS